MYRKHSISVELRKTLESYPNDFIRDYLRYKSIGKLYKVSHSPICLENFKQKHESCDNCIIHVQFLFLSTFTLSPMFEEVRINFKHPNWFGELKSRFGAKDIVSEGGISISKMTREQIVSCDRMFFATVMVEKKNFEIPPVYHPRNDEHLIKFWSSLLDHIQKVIGMTCIEVFNECANLDSIPIDTIHVVLNERISNLLKSQELYKPYGCMTFDQFIGHFYHGNVSGITTKTLHGYINKKMCIPTKIILSETQGFVFETIRNMNCKKTNQDDYDAELNSFFKKLYSFIQSKLEPVVQDMKIHSKKNLAKLLAGNDDDSIEEIEHIESLKRSSEVIRCCQEFEFPHLNIQFLSEETNLSK